MNRIYTTIITQNGERNEVNKRFVTGFIGRIEEKNGFCSISIGADEYRDGKKVTEYIRVTISKNASDKFKDFVLNIPVGSKVAIVANVVKNEGKDGKIYENNYLEALDICHYNKKKESTATSSINEKVPAAVTNVVNTSETTRFDNYEEAIIEDGDLPF